MKWSATIVARFGPIQMPASFGHLAQRQSRGGGTTVMKAYLIGGAVAAFAIASAAATQPAPPPGVAQGTGPAMMAPAPPAGMPQMRVMIGGDHVMTRQEVAEHVGKLFAKLDANH